MKNKRYLAFIGSSTTRAEMSLDLNAAAEEIIAVDQAIHKINSHRQLHFLMGLVDLRDITESALRGFSAQIQQCRLHSISCDWIGLVHSNDLDNDRLRQWIRSECVDFWLHPFQRLRDHLRQFLAQHSIAHSAAGTEDLRNSYVDLIGSSPGMHHMRQLIDRFSKVNSPILIIGETGSGKELIARNIHHASTRAKGKFMALNCGAMSPQLVQSELFGHEKGSFTGANHRKIGIIEAAQGGTLLLDEIGDLPLDAQVNFLRFLQEGKITRVGGTEEIAVDLRIVAATHVNLEQAVAHGKFREDLLYRLNVLKIDAPPLRERGSDVLVLADHILNHLKKTNHITARGFDMDATHALLAHSWPGNVRELTNRIQRAAVMCDRALIAAYELGLNAQPASAAAHLGEARDHAEAIAIEEALMSQGYNFSRAAKALGISRVTLYRLASKHASRLSSQAMREMPSALPPPSDFMPLSGGRGNTRH
ncbi:MAG: sigma 54-interacting transcriptional regulator [Burkholderiaceae bacterium]